MERRQAEAMMLPAGHRLPPKMATGVRDILTNLGDEFFRDLEDDDFECDTLNEFDPVLGQAKMRIGVGSVDFEITVDVEGYADINIGPVMAGSAADIINYYKKEFD